MLVEFASVVDAVQCAVEVQRAMVERNAGATLEHRIEFRVGINGGDIIDDEGDIFEDGVNIAARLESIAVRGAANLKQDIRHARPRRSQSAGGFWPRNSGWYT